ncbi:MAG: response regulator [Ferruginibacter sp.]|nr:response regulator [Ferruginibacter sp.]
MFKTFVLLLGIAIPFLLFSQSDLYQFDAIDSKSGLSNNQVNSIFKDEKGYLWFGTMAGLNRFDGYNFKIFKHNISDTTSINDDYIIRIMQGPDHMLWVNTRSGWNIFDSRTEKFTRALGYINKIRLPDERFSTIVPDGKNNFWFIFPGKGIYKYNATANTTTIYNDKNVHDPLYSVNVNSSVVDRAGFLWVAYAEGIFEKRDGNTNKLLYRTGILQQYIKNSFTEYQLFTDADNDLWIYTTGSFHGVFYFNTSLNSLRYINKDSKNIRLNNDIILGIAQDDKGNIWVATDHGGINLINKKNFSIRYLVNNENDNKSLSQNSVNAIYKDNDGIIWLGTFKKGINYFHESSLKFPLYQHKAGNNASLFYNDVNRFMEDKKGNLWIGTNGGGLIYFNRATGTYKQYLHDASNTNSLSNNVIVSLQIDSEDKLWIGTYGGGLDCFDGGKFTNYRHDDQNPSSLADDRVWEIYEDSRKRLWIGTLTEGLELFDKKEKIFIHYRSYNVYSKYKYVSAITEDKSGNLLIGTAVGIEILDNQSGMFSHYQHVENDRASLSQNNVADILNDSRGLTWIATRDGLNLFDPAKGQFKTFRIEDGLPDNTILTLQEDKNHNLWIGTPNGLSNVTVHSTDKHAITITCKNYDESDGLQGRQFNENAAFKTSKGELVFGGPNGFNIFLPSAIKENTFIPRIILTDLQIFNSSIKAGEKYNGRVVLPEAINEVKEITLKYNQNVFTIEFAALEFLHPEKIKYAYKLEGFGGDWLTTNAKNRKATFTNLDPGTYTLLVKAGNEDGKWLTPPLSLKIHVLPPFWLSPLAFIIYLLIFAGSLIFARNMVVRQAKLKFAIEQERQKSNRLHELDMMKIKFFTNVSHEFRTPLSLILTPVEKLLTQGENSASKPQFQLIHRNARRLLNLVNQLLDFRKLEENELRLNETPGDIIQFIKEISLSFSDIGENKRISFSIEAPQDMIFTSFDHDKLERVLFNLLSNAFKFTQVGGTVKVSVAVSGIHPEEKILQLKIIDNGIGINRDMQEKIFERFFQNEIPGSMLNQGSGIGLSITKEFIRLQGGSIMVESEVDEGSCFIVTLPLKPCREDTGEYLPASTETFVTMVEKTDYVPGLQTADEKINNVKKKSILLVEDNEDFRFYIKDNLRAFYKIIEAPNGKIGWQKALSEHPDLIVTDISMPEMNGIELCQKIRSDQRTSFLPVILLTALTGEDHQLQGLQTGANDYITKPFNFEILLSKIKNQLSQQEKFKKTYQKQVQANALEVVTVPVNDSFIQQVLAVIEKNMANPDFSVEQMSRVMCMSRGALYKKMFSLTGKTPLEFIQSIRMQRAAQLLEKGEMTVAEVAYEVGFNNPKYFSKNFKLEYNALPSSFLATKKNGDGHK